MTPFAQSIARQYLVPAVKRTFRGGVAADVLRLLVTRGHTFGVTGILGAAAELIDACESTVEGVCDRTFLPAEVTFLEADIAGRGRCGLLLVERGDEADVFCVLPERAERLGAITLREGLRAYAGQGLPIALDGGLAGVKSADRATLVILVYGLLNIINWPNMCARQQHPAHRGLARDLRRAGVKSLYPLNGWSEITLRPGQPLREPKAADGNGSMPLHFVRAHLRAGVLIAPHWRGDPANGTKHGRYTVLPPRAA
jgi:hypothetical protein